MLFSRLISSLALMCAFACCSADDAVGTTDDNEQVTTQPVTLSESELSLAPTESFTLTATVSPDPTIGITWASSDTKVATIFMGTVTATGLGETLISVMTDLGDMATCTVTVSQSDYSLVWSEEFDGDTLDTTNTWNIEINGNGCGNSEAQYYTDREENVRLEDGNLVIQAYKEDYDWAEYTSARLTTSGKFDFTYGKIEASIDLPAGGGVWPAFWMMGYGSWPSCGEIDILEYVGNNPGYIIHALHTSAKNGSNGLNWSSNPAVEDLEEGYHTFGIEWEECIYDTRDIIRFYVDGVKTAEYYDPVTYDDNSQWPYTDEFYILLNLAIGGTLGGTIDDSIFDEDVIMKVDWIRVYQRI